MVEETLLFAARLRLPDGTSRQEVAARVDVVIGTLGLQDARRTLVGGPLRRGISGGERKRVALGIDLIVNPALLFLDEPTSGLDAFNAQTVANVLRELADSGRTIVACLHQPRSGSACPHSRIVRSSHAAD